MLTDDIERFIKGLLSEGERQIELQRNDLAQHFGCAPSQINYVLSTRFTLDHGYVIESRRGGGGYIRIAQVMLPGGRSELFLNLLERVGSALPQEAADAIVKGMLEAEVIDEREALLMSAACDARQMAIPAAAKDHVRAGIVRNMLEALLVYNAKEEET